MLEGAKSAFTVGELPSYVIKGTSPEQQKYRRVRFSIELAWSLKKKSLMFLLSLDNLSISGNAVVEIAVLYGRNRGFSQ